MYKLGPIHQGSLERGAKTSSDSYILWPARIGAFSLVMGRHVGNVDTSDMPFSYLIEEHGMTFLVPAVNLKSVGTIRDAQKWPRRDGRRDPHLLDQINYNLLSPYTMQKALRGIELLRQLRRVSGRTSDTYTYYSAKIKRNALERGIDLYNVAVTKFLGNSLIHRLQGFSGSTIEELRQYLRPYCSAGLGEWVDLQGLIAPKQEVDDLIAAIESGEVADIPTLNSRFCELHKAYYDMEWTWAYNEMLRYFNLEPDTITVADLTGIIDRWRDAVVGLDRMVYEDAKKEFSLSSKTGFGADGSKFDVEKDFEQVRGAFESNSFVMAVTDHIRKKSQLGEEAKIRLRSVK